MRVFLMCVGTRDPYWAKRDGKQIAYNSLTPQDESSKLNGPILTFFNLLLPPPKRGDRVFLFSTQAAPKVLTPTEKGAEATKRELEMKYEGIQVEHWRFPKDIDPSEFIEVYYAMEKLITKVQEAVQDEEIEEQIVFVSPGTPQMQAAWFVLAHTGRLKAKLFRIFFEDQTPQLLSVDLGPLVISDLISSALEAFKRQDFAESAAMFEKLTLRLAGASRRRAQLCVALARLYSSWFALDYQAALRSLEKSQNDYPDLLRHYPKLNEYLQAAKEALNERQSPSLKARATDLFYAACRRLEQGDAIEALWRFATLVEIIEVALAQDVGYKGSLRGGAHRYLCKRGKEHALSSLEDEKWLFRLRNLSIHKGKPVSQSAAEKAKELAGEALRRYFGVDEGSHPLSPSSLQVLHEYLRELIS